MVNALLTALSGVTYLPVKATDTLINPALEIGDPVNLYGNQTVMASVTYHGGPALIADVEAPIEEEVNHEYPAKTTSKAERKLASAYSQIKKTTDNIALEVAGKTDSDDVNSLIDVSLNGITLSYTGTTNGATLSLTKSGVNISGTVKVGSIDASQITVSNINASNITGGYIDANQIAVVNLNASNITSGYLSADRISGGTIDASYINVVNLDADYITTGTLDASRVTLGYGSSGFDCPSTNKARMYYGSSTEIRVSNNGCAMTTSGGELWAGTSAAGVTGLTWQSGSDRELKQSIDYGAEYENFFDMLKLVEFEFKRHPEEKHYGFIAQDVQAALDACGLSDRIVGKLKHHKESESDTKEFDLALAYDEFIPLCVDQIQKLKKRLDELEGGLKQ
jgi:hypothetical protein